MAVFEKRIANDGILRYRAKVRVKGYPTQSMTFRRLSDAKRWSKKIETEIHQGLCFPQVGNRKHTLAELIDRYLEEILPKKSKAMQVIQEHQLRWWKKALGPYLLKDITPAFIIEKRTALGKGTVKGDVIRSPSTCNRYIAALRHAFTIAQRDWEWMSDNPAKRVVKLKEPAGRIRCLDEDERRRLLVECQKSKSPFLHQIVSIALSTGMRYNEILSLSWKQISFAEGVLILYKTKNQRPRRVPIQGDALATLKIHSKIRRIDTDLVFPSPNNPSKPINIVAAWNRAVARANIENFCFHDLRHTAASYFSMSGASARDLCDIFGWLTIQMAMRYAHLFESHTVELAAKMNAKFLDERPQPEELLVMTADRSF